MNASAVRLGLVCVAVVAGVVATTPAARQSPVLINVAVTGEGSERVPGLTASDFEVLVDGKPTPIESVAAPPVPLTLVLILDVTASMGIYTDSDEIVTAFADALAAGDRARVAGLAGRIQLAPRFANTPRDLTSDARTVLRFKREEKSGPSPIWDAIDAATKALEPEPGRRGLIVVTDGRATGNKVGAQAAVERAMLAGITVHVLTEARPIIIRQGVDTVARVRSGLVLQELTRLTGGLCVPDEATPPGESPQAKLAIPSFVRDLRAMYTLGVAPDPTPGTAHRVEVKVKRPNLSVRARSGYRT
jgi:Ca-activated chloride channel family protein